MKNLPTKIYININIQNNLTNNNPYIIKKLNFKIPNFKKYNII